MTEHPEEPQGGPDEVQTDEQLDVEGPNESAQPSGAPGLDDGGGGGNGGNGGNGNGDGNG